MSAEEKKKKVLAEMDTLMRSLRQCGTQATAIEWMTRAYNAMDGATRLIGDLERMVREEASESRGLIFQIPPPRLEVVQSIPKIVAHRVIEAPSLPYKGPANVTVIYPEIIQHPGLRPIPTAWTRKDTRKLEAASKMGPHRIVKKGR